MLAAHVFQQILGFVVVAVPRHVNLGRHLCAVFGVVVAFLIQGQNPAVEEFDCPRFELSPRIGSDGRGLLHDNLGAALMPVDFLQKLFRLDRTGRNAQGSGAARQAAGRVEAFGVQFDHRLTQEFLRQILVVVFVLGCRIGRGPSGGRSGTDLRDDRRRVARRLLDFRRIVVGEKRLERREDSQRAGNGQRMPFQSHGSPFRFAQKSARLGLSVIRVPSLLREWRHQIYRFYGLDE